MKMLRLTDEQMTTHQAWKGRESAREIADVKSIGKPCAANEPAKPLRLTRPVEPESSVLANVLRCLRMHRKVAWVSRMNSGMLYDKTGRPVFFGFPGLSDIVGETTAGLFLACECKVIGKEPTADQAAFIERVRRHGGVAFVARGIDDVLRELGPA